MSYLALAVFAVSIDWLIVDDVVVVFIPLQQIANKLLYHSICLGIAGAQELCEDPQLFVGGASRLDIQQGNLGEQTDSRSLAVD